MEQSIGLVANVTPKETKTNKVYYELEIDGKKGFSWNKHFAEASGRYVKYTEEVSKINASFMSYEFVEFVEAPVIPVSETPKVEAKPVPNGKQAEFVKSALASKALELAVSRANVLPRDQITTDGILGVADFFLKWLNEKSV